MEEDLSVFCNISNFCSLPQEKIAVSKAEFKGRQEVRGSFQWFLD